MGIGEPPNLVSGCREACPWFGYRNEVDLTSVSSLNKAHRCKRIMDSLCESSELRVIRDDSRQVITDVSVSHN